MIELLLQAEGALSVGLLDRAETLYRQVANADPRNAIAVVGLSRVALERGQQHTALQLARQALAIDNENVAADRMVRRLEEVLAYRGDATTGAGLTLASPTETEPPAPAAAPAPDRAPATPTPPRPAPTQPKPERRSLLDRLRRRS